MNERERVDTGKDIYLFNEYVFTEQLLSLPGAILGPRNASVNETNFLLL